MEEYHEEIINKKKTILPEINSDLLTFEQWIELEKLRSQNSAAGLSLIESFANSGIKTIMMLNGGAAIAMLAFLGNIIITDYSKWIYGIVWALGGYSIGAVCSAVIAFFLTYLKALIMMRMNKLTKALIKIDLWQ